MFVGEEDSPFGNLPAEMIVKILKTNPYKGGKYIARKVCRRWRWIVDEPWWGLVSFKARIDGNESSAVTFIKSQIQFKSLFIRGIRKIDWPEMSLLEPLPGIQKIIFGSELSEESLLTFLSCGGGILEYLNFLDSSLASVTASTFESLISVATWSNLTELQMSVTVPSAGFANEDGTAIVQNAQELKIQNKVEGHSHAIACFLRLASLPKLKIFNFHLTSNVGDEVGSQMTTVISEFTGFLERHGVTLKSLSLSIYLCLTAQPKFCLIGPIFSAERQESIGKTLNFESFTFLNTHSSSLVNLVPPCLWESSKLTKLSLATNLWTHSENDGDDEITSPHLTNPVQSMILKSQETLVNADITFGHEGDNGFQLNWLEPCSALRDLTLMYMHNITDTSVQLPQVTSLSVCLLGRGHRSGWITKSFENVEYLSIDCLTKMDNTRCEWLENLLPLIKLKLKRIKFSPNVTCNDARFFQIVRGYCRNNAKLDYVSDGLINVLPPL